MAGPTYYDVLGLDRDASPEEVKGAWQEAVGRFDPGSSTSQLRLFNTAAEVLLDPVRRAEYDRTLEPLPSEPAEAPPPSASTGRGVPGWVLVALTVVTGIAVGLAGYFFFQAHQAAGIEAAESRAPQVAEAAATSVLSYDYRRLAADRDAAASLMTPQYRKQYVDTFDGVVVSGAKQTKARVKAEVQASGVTRATPDRCEVLLFVDQTTLSTANDGQPQTALNRVRFSMVRSGDTWLVDDISSF